MKERVTQRFLKYVAVDTQSDEASDTFPSTEKQKVLAKMLVEELRRMGVPQVEIDEQYGYVYAKILSNRPDGEKVPVLGFIGAYGYFSRSIGSGCKTADYPSV